MSVLMCGWDAGVLEYAVQEQKPLDEIVDILMNWPKNRWHERSLALSMDLRAAKEPEPRSADQEHVAALLLAYSDAPSLCDAMRDANVRNDRSAIDRLLNGVVVSDNRWPQIIMRSCHSIIQSQSAMHRSTDTSVNMLAQQSFREKPG